MAVYRRKFRAPGRSMSVRHTLGAIIPVDNPVVVPMQQFASSGNVTLAAGVYRVIGIGGGGSGTDNGGAGGDVKEFLGAVPAGVWTITVGDGGAPGPGGQTTVSHPTLGSFCVAGGGGSAGSNFGGSVGTHVGGPGTACSGPTGSALGGGGGAGADGDGGGGGANCGTPPVGIGGGGGAGKAVAGFSTYGGGGGGIGSTGNGTGGAGGGGNAGQNGQDGYGGGGGGGAFGGKGRVIIIPQ